MPLIEPLPKSLRASVEAEGLAGEPAVVAVSTDFLPHGSYGREWLIVTPSRLRVFTVEGNGTEQDNAGNERGWLGGRLFGGGNGAGSTDTEKSNGSGAGVNGPAPSPRLEAKLDTLTSARTQSFVGGGALEAIIDGKSVELLRFTAGRQRTFSQVGRYLDQLAKHRAATAKGEAKEPPTIDEDKDSDKRCPRCRILLPEGTKICPACVNKTRVLVRLSGYLRPYRRQIVIITLMLLAGTLMGLITPYLSRPLMDVVLVPHGEPLPKAEREKWLAAIVAGMLLSQVVGLAIHITRQRAAAWLTHQLAHSLRMELYQHLQKLSLRFYDKRQVGALMSRVTQDTQQLESVLTTGSQVFVMPLLTLVGVVAILVSMDWRLFLCVIVPLPFVVALTRRTVRRLRHVWPRWWHTRMRLHAVINDSLSGVRVVKAFAQEDREVSRFGPRSLAVAEAGLDAERTWSTIMPALGFLSGLGALVVWYVGGRGVLDEKMTVGTLTTFIAYAGMLYGPLNTVTDAPRWFAQAMAAAERIFDILDTAPDVPDVGEPVRLPRIEGRVTFENITFGYDPLKPVLHEVSLDVAPGEMIGLVGHSGAGKSTTINLLCRFYDPVRGRLLIDGVDAKQIAQKDLRSQIGLVLQDTFLFSGTVAENIAYARPEATREEIMAAAKAANAHDFIAAKPDGYDTPVGDRGGSLSGGERQRIAIARAILHNPRILILDEATSSVDTDTEKQIQDAIARLIKGRTTFAIAHRLSTLRNASRLVVLKGGKIEEMGTHDELMAKKGEFFRLVEMQQEMSRIKAIAR
ncbi:MAG: ABC transporter ATP-binding protein [Planctomycetota bacterium]|nr:ABC transporter ATP-binding protein [Planctomycetota bacterium]